MDLMELYHFAETRQIDVDFCALSLAEALALEEPDGRCAIAINPRRLKGTGDEAVKLAHELGHCETGSFYASGAPLDERGRCEARATRWAIRRLLPYEAMKQAIAEGERDESALAEKFSVTEEFVRQAVNYYRDTCGLTFA